MPVLELANYKRKIYVLLAELTFKKGSTLLLIRSLHRGADVDEA
jgi:hypothetical protein